jgi:hypothetical protein
MTYFTKLRCDHCNSTITMKETEKWVSMKCKCRCAIYYSTGYFVVIPKKVYIKNKESKVSLDGV